MEKPQLLDYLKAAIEMESAIYSCKLAIKEVDLALAAPYKSPVVPAANYRPKPASRQPLLPCKPAEPVPPKERPLPEAERISVKLVLMTFAGMYIPAAFVATGVLYLLYRIFHDDVFSANPSKTVIFSVFGIILVLMSLGYLGMQFSKSEKKRKQDTATVQKKNMEDKQIYDQRLREYRQAIAVYASECEQAKKRACMQSQQDLQLWQEENRKKDADHTMLLDSANKIEEAHRLQLETLKREKRRLTNKQVDLECQLEQFYEKGVLYPNFRNYVAVAQLYDYLASGISNQLEGPDGAYAQYMNDVRIARICESIEQLRKDIREGMTAVLQMQYSICEELRSCERAVFNVGRAVREINRDFNDFRGDFDSAVRSFGRNMSDLSASVVDIGNRADEYRSVLSSISSGIDNISNTSSATAYNTAMIGLNQYLDMKTRGVNGYYAMYGG